MKPLPVSVTSLPSQDETYLQAGRMGELLYLCGQPGVRPYGALPDIFRKELRQALDNVAAVLEAAG